jgi:hypothetical protein
MKKAFLLFFLAIPFFAEAQQYEYKVVTSVESIVPAGIGRSRIISEEDETLNYEDFTTERTDGKKSKQGDVKRSDAKIDNFEETKLLNFFSVTGINFQNIASNDALISDKINKMIAGGWDLAFVVSGVESDAGKGDGEGIFITRYIFKRAL